MIRGCCDRLAATPWGVALAALLWACGAGDHCTVVPCPLPIAVQLAVTAAAGGPVAGATIAISGPTIGGGPCNAGPAVTMCQAPGGPGKYTLTVSAPGFQTATVTVDVGGHVSSGCGCTTADTQSATLVLQPQA
ncbi:MAG: hypothetical protein KGJ70_05850 [Gemmatimonadota bacterium]|nr:hypothetical protein [Gemmatimonadota bacterium]